MSSLSFVTLSAWDNETKGETKRTTACQYHVNIGFFPPQWKAHESWVAMPHTWNVSESKLAEFLVLLHELHELWWSPELITMPTATLFPHLYIFIIKKYLTNIILKDCNKWYWMKTCFILWPILENSPKRGIGSHMKQVHICWQQSHGLRTYWPIQYMWQSLGKEPICKKNNFFFFFFFFGLYECIIPYLWNDIQLMVPFIMLPTIQLLIHSSS